MRSQIVKNIVFLAIFYLLSAALVRAGAYFGAGWPIVGQMIGAAVGLALSYTFNARIAASFWAVVFAMTAPEVLIQVGYGRGFVSGAPVRFALLGTSMLGVGVGLFLGQFPLNRRGLAATSD